MAEATAWYLGLLILGVAGLAPAALLFYRLESRGILLARPVALGVVGLGTWLTVRLTPIPYSTGLVVLWLVALLVLSAVIVWQQPQIAGDLLSRFQWIGASEAATLVCFVVLVLVRSDTPDAIATEKPADLMLMTAVHRASDFPPLDPWLSGELITYYHLGQVQMDVLARMAGIGPEFTFNLATATMGALAIVGVAGLAGDIMALGATTSRRRLAFGGIIAGASLVLAAPLIGLVQVLAAHGIGGAAPWGWLGVEGVPTLGGARGLAPAEFWWWWETTRILPTIGFPQVSEYPAFTLLLGDPHAHLLVLPTSIVALALAVQVFQGSIPLAPGAWMRSPVRWVLTSVVFATLAMTNTWDAVTFGALWGVAAWWAATRTGWSAPMGLFVAVRWAALPTMLALAMAWPFFITLDPNPLGLALTRGEHADPTRFALLWLPVLAPVVAGLVLLRPTVTRHWRRAAIGLGALLVAWVLVLLLAAPGELLDRGWGWLTLLGLAAGIVVTGSIAAAGTWRTQATSTAAALVAGGLTILLATELVHVDDAFAGRFNTAFKFWFHAWAIFAVAGGVLGGLGLRRLLDEQPPEAAASDAAIGDEPRRAAGGNRGRRTGVWVAGGLGVLWLASMVGTAAMTISRGNEDQGRGLNAVAYLGDVDPGLRATVRWTRFALDPEDAVLVQAVGEPYSKDDLLASYSGIPTLLAWPGHERQWRGEIEEQARREAVRTIYLGSDAAAQAVAEAWGVTHVYVGAEERRIYGPTAGDGLLGWPLAFEEGGSVVYMVPGTETASGREGGE